MQPRATVTQEFDRFEARTRRLIYLTFPLRWFREHQEELDAPLKEMHAKGVPWFPTTVQGLAVDLVGFAACLESAMLWTFYDEYNRSVHRGPTGQPHDGTKTIVARLPKFTVQCHRSHARVHVLEAVEDIRNRFIHAHILNYRHLTCNLPPEQILLRSMEIVGEESERIVFSQDDVLSDPTVSEERSRTTIGVHRFRSLSFGELLEENLLECASAYDQVIERRRGQVRPS